MSQTRNYAVRPSSARSAPLSSSNEGLPGAPASILAPFVLLAAAALYLRANWNRIPERFPVHWGLSGAPDRWAGRGWFGVYGTLLFGALLITLLLVFAEAILRASPRARTPESAGWTARFRRANLRLIMATVWGLSAMLALTSLAPLFMQGGRAP